MRKPTESAWDALDRCWPRYLCGHEDQDIDWCEWDLEIAGWENVAEHIDMHYFMLLGAIDDAIERAAA